MKVALVTPRFPPDVGGLESYVGWVAETLRDTPSCEVTVVTTGAGRRITRQTFRGISVIRLGTWTKVSNTPVNLLWSAQLRRLLRDLRVDVVSAHAPVPGLADLAAFTSPVPVVLTYHSGSLEKGHAAVDMLLRAYERHVLPAVFRRCTELIAVSPASMAVRSGRAHLVPPGVDTRLFCPDSSEPSSRRVLYVGRVEKSSRWKGLHVLIEAMDRLRRDIPDVRLDVVGDGDDVPVLSALARRLGVSDAIAWHGRVPHGELAAFYRRAGVTVLPSLTESESFGMTLVEAMATGCPVVGSAVGGIPFVVRDGIDGLLVEPGDPLALADALRLVLTSPTTAASLGAAGREAAVSRWDWNRQSERTLAVLRQAATSREVVGAG
jgi:glycosyltransferase involved in cell wall biosynthesis